MRCPSVVTATRRSSTAPAATSRSRIAALSMAACSRVSTTTDAVRRRRAALPRRGRRARRAAPPRWRARAIWPRACSASNTAAGSSPARMARLSCAYSVSAHSVGRRTVWTNRCTVSRSTQASGWTQRCGEVEHAAAADRGQLVPVTDQRDPRAGLVGDGQQRAGGVLVEHPGLVDQQHVTASGSQPGRGRRPVSGRFPAVAGPARRSSSHRQPCC